MNETIKVKIEADINSLSKELSRADTLLKQHEGNYKRIQSAIASNTKEANNLQGKLKTLNSEFQKGAINEAKYLRETDKLSDKLREVNGNTSAYQRELKRVEGEIKRVTSATQNYNAAANKTSGTTTQLEGTVGKLGKTTKVNAVPAMTSFSQIIQDAPYGINGVANNIQQLTMQMGYLSTRAGGTKSAMSALVGSLAGPAGVLLAVSLVTSLLVQYEGKLAELVGSTNKLAEATKKYVGEAMAEASELKVLVDIANNHNASIISRRKAIEEINSKYGEYLGNIDEESIKTDKVKDSINKLTKALIQQAQIKGLKDIIGEETAKAAEKLTMLQIRQRDLYGEIRKELKKMDNTGYWGKVIRDSDDVIGSLERIAATGEKVPSGLASAVGSYKEVNKEIKNIGSETAKAIEPFQDLQQALSEQVFSITAVPEFDQDEIVIKGKETALRVKVNPILEQGAFLRDAELLNSQLMGSIAFLKDLQKQLPENGKAYERVGESIAQFENRLSENRNFLSEYAKSTSQELLSIGEALDAQNAEMMRRAAERNQAYIENQKLLAQIATQTFSALGNSIVDNLGKGEEGLQDFVKTLFSVVGKVIVGLVAQSIGNAIVAGTQTAASSGPAAAFVLPGLVAGSIGVVKSAFGQVPQFAQGGVVGGNSYTGDKILARLNSGEVVLNRAQQQAALALMASPPGMGQGASGQLEIVGESRIEGDAIIIAYRRAERRNNRIS